MCDKYILRDGVGVTLNNNDYFREGGERRGLLVSDI